MSTGQHDQHAAHEPAATHDRDRDRNETVAEHLRQHHAHMVAELDPGTPAAPPLQDGDTIPISQTLPDVNLDEILASWTWS